MTLSPSRRLVPPQNFRLHLRHFHLRLRHLHLRLRHLHLRLRHLHLRLRHHHCCCSLVRSSSTSSRTYHTRAEYSCASYSSVNLSQNPPWKHHVVQSSVVSSSLRCILPTDRRTLFRLVGQLLTQSEAPQGG